MLAVHDFQLQTDFHFAFLFAENVHVWDHGFKVRLWKLSQWC